MQMETATISGVSPKNSLALSRRDATASAGFSIG